MSDKTKQRTMQYAQNDIYLKRFYLDDKIIVATRERERRRRRKKLIDII